MALPINKRDYELSSGEIISVGMNFRALEIMSQYPGGLRSLKKNMSKMALSVRASEAEEDAEEISDAYDEALPTAMHAMAFMLHALILAGGTKCTQEEAMMAIGPSDFEQLSQIFDEFSEAMAKMTGKNSPGRMMAAR